MRIVSQFLQKITHFLRCHDVGRAESQKHTITRTNTHAFTQKKHIYSTHIHRHTNRNTYTIHVFTDTQTETYTYKKHIRTQAFSHTQTRAPQAHHTYVIVGV